MTYVALARLSIIGKKEDMQLAKPHRRRNAASTKAEILLAAKRAFADLGYSQTGIRHIAALAGVDSALIQRYFGSKAGLFEAALSDAIPRFNLAEIERPQFGVRLTRDLLANLIDLCAHSMIVLSTSDAEAREICARTLNSQAVEPLAEWLGPPNARARAVRMIMLTTGFMLFTRQVELLPPDDAFESGTSVWLSDLLQEIIGVAQP